MCWICECYQQWAESNSHRITPKIQNLWKNCVIMNFNKNVYKSNLWNKYFLFPYLDYQEKNFVNKLSLMVWNYMAAKHLFSENSVLLEKKNYRHLKGLPVLNHK